MIVMVINSGSSSLKYQLFDMNTEEVLAKGICERIGIDGVLKHTAGSRETLERSVTLNNHQAAMEQVMEILTSKDDGVIASLDEISAVGHRVAHGGSYFTSSTRIDREVREAIADCVPLAPLHNPAALMGIDACIQVLGEKIPQVAVFDTAFHQSIPREAYTYALPKELCKKHRIRRYGFHGTSHKYVAELAAGLLQKPLESLKIITCHLGNGSSIAAVKHGESVDTTMGFTPLEGLPMGTRSGTIDPAIVPFLMEQEGLSVKAVDSLLNKESGLNGISGVSSDLRDIRTQAEAGNEDAANAVNVLCYQIKKTIGAYTAAMGGVDAVVFTAGIGENSPDIRRQSVEGLECLGLCIDPAKNAACKGGGDVSKTDSPARILVIPTNEEWVIAKDTFALAR